MLMTAQMLALRTKLRLREFFTKEDGEVNIVTIVVLIGIAVALALIFRKQIETLLVTLFATITEQATKAVGGK